VVLVDYRQLDDLPVNGAVPAWLQTLQLLDLFMANLDNHLDSCVFLYSNAPPEAAGRRPHEQKAAAAAVTKALKKVKAAGAFANVLKYMTSAKNLPPQAAVRDAADSADAVKALVLEGSCLGVSTKHADLDRKPLQSDALRQLAQACTLVKGSVENLVMRTPSYFGSDQLLDCLASLKVLSVMFSYQADLGIGKAHSESVSVLASAFDQACARAEHLLEADPPGSGFAQANEIMQKLAATEAEVERVQIHGPQARALEQRKGRVGQLVNQLAEEALALVRGYADPAAAAPSSLPLRARLKDPAAAPAALSAATREKLDLLSSLAKHSELARALTAEYSGCYDIAVDAVAGAVEACQTSALGRIENRQLDGTLGEALSKLKESTTELRGHLPQAATGLYSQTVQALFESLQEQSGVILLQLKDRQLAPSGGAGDFGAPEPPTEAFSRLAEVRFGALSAAAQLLGAHLAGTFDIGHSVGNVVNRLRELNQTLHHSVEDASAREGGVCYLEIGALMQKIAVVCRVLAKGVGPGESRMEEQQLEKRMGTVKAHVDRHAAFLAQVRCLPYTARARSTALQKHCATCATWIPLELAACICSLPCAASSSLLEQGVLVLCHSATSGTGLTWPPTLSHCRLPPSRSTTRRQAAGGTKTWAGTCGCCKRRREAWRRCPSGASWP
jgi:hypothetical protein